MNEPHADELNPVIITEEFMKSVSVPFEDTLEGKRVINIVSSELAKDMDRKMFELFTRGATFTKVKLEK